jgi:hypothetical protein
MVRPSLVPGTCLQAEETREPARNDEGMPPAESPPETSKPVPRAIVAALIGAEAGAGIGLVFFGSIPMAPLAFAVGGALAGPPAGMAVAVVRRALVARQLRHQIRAAHPPPPAESQPASR